MTKKISGGVVHELPADLRKALAADPKALAKWESLTPLARNEWICWTISVKTPKTRDEHVSRVVSELKEGMRRPCCWIGCIHRKDKALSASQKWVLSTKSKKIKMEITAKTEYFFKTMKSPVGELKLVASDKGLVAILWEHDNPRRVQVREYIKSNNHSILLKTEKELKEYFAKKRKKFTVKMDFVGTEFQKKVWVALLTIPFGETRSYADIAKQIKNSTAVRAVGGAIGKNPIAIITPCHRVIGTSGKLTGFAGGLANKKCLLDLETKK